MDEFQQKFDKLAKLPWRTGLIAAAVGFLLASFMSLAMVQFVMPSGKDLRPERNVVQAGANQIVFSDETLGEHQWKSILDRNVFNSEGKYPDADVQGDEGDDDGRIVESTLPLTLLGVISGGNPYVGIAMVENKKKRSINSFMVGETLLKGQNVTLEEIYPKRIILLHNGRKEFLKVKIKPVVRMSRKAGTASSRGFQSSQNANSDDYFAEDGFERKGNQVNFTKAYKADLLGPKLGEVLRGAKAVPRKGPNGRINGWKLVNIRPNSIYQKMGLKNGDVVTEINGYPLSDAAKAIKFMKSVKKEDRFSIRVEKGGSSPYNLEIGAD